MTVIDRTFLAIILCLVGVALCLKAFADPIGSNTAPYYLSPSFTFATLPTAKPGTVVYMSDGATGNCGDSACTTWGTTVTGGGGSLKLLIWYNNANWTLVGK